jgi:hypothetical protein
MKKLGIAFLLSISLMGLSFSIKKSINKNSVATVSVKKVGRKYQLLRNGEPFFIKGAGGYEKYEELKACGGNSVRIWSANNAKEYLDKAHALGLTVLLSLHMEHERRGFNYSNKKLVKEQFDRIKKEILQFKDHPALLMWGVGNEVDQFASNYEVWDAVHDIVKYIHEVDPKHPATTMLAGVPAHHIKEIMKRCPDLDILSINAFKWIQPVRKDITAAGWRGPYLIGEWGASGYWESEKVPWGTFIEETSTQKAESFEDRYKYIANNDDRCLGSYVFIWGWKQARTHTLLSLFSEDGKETGMVDVLHKLWTGEERANRAPKIVPIGIDDQLTHKGIYLKPSTSHTAYTEAKDPDGDPLFYFWEIYEESKERKEGGDHEEKPALQKGLIPINLGKALSFKAPEKEGAYRIFVTVYDGKNHIATANAPFYVKN